MTARGLVASSRDAMGEPVHHGWPCGGRGRWMAPFVLVLLAEEPTYGYALIGRLEEMGVAEGQVDVGQVYKTLRCLEEHGHVESSWSAERVGPQRRDYRLTEAGREALEEWAAVMEERVRLIRDFQARYRRSKAHAAVD